MWLNIGSPVRVDFKFGSEAADEGGSDDQQRRIQEKTCIGREPWQDQLIDGGGSRKGPSSRRTATGSTQRRKRIKERTFIQRIIDMINSSTEEDQAEDLHPEDQRQDQLIDGRGSRSEPSLAGDPGEFLHRQTEEGRSSTSAQGSAGPQATSKIRPYTFHLTK